MSTQRPNGPIDARTGRYALDTSQPAEKQRLDEQAALWDPLTFRQLHHLGVTDGWRCLEVGGGSGTIASWLCERVGRTGQVVATDLETRWLADLAAPNLEVRRHDVVVDPLEESTYDLVHARIVLTHLPERDAVLTKLARAVRPGGWLLVEDYDGQTFGVSEPAHPAWAKVARATFGALESAGADLSYGRRLPAAFRSAGLADVSAEGLVHIGPAPSLAPVIVPVLARLRERIVDLGSATATEVDQVIAELDDEGSSLWIHTPILISVRGKANR